MILIEIIGSMVAIATLLVSFQLLQYGAAIFTRNPILQRVIAVSAYVVLLLLLIQSLTS